MLAERIESGQWRLRATSRQLADLARDEAANPHIFADEIETGDEPLVPALSPDPNTRGLTPVLSPRRESPVPDVELALCRLKDTLDVWAPNLKAVAHDNIVDSMRRYLRAVTE
jgi:hypothetical protein